MAKARRKPATPPKAPVIELFPRQLARALGVGRGALLHRVAVIQHRPPDKAPRPGLQVELIALGELCGVEALRETANRLATRMIALPELLPPPPPNPCPSETLRLVPATRDG